MKSCLILLLSLFLGHRAIAQNDFVKGNYNKAEYAIAMRDGTKLHTIVYAPKDASPTNAYPFLMQRTCYDVAPYGEGKFPKALGPSKFLMNDKYIFVYQDVRGRYMSEGTWTNMTPHIANKTKNTDVDEASDTYDTIE